MKKQFIVQEHGVNERWDFYNYIHDNYNLNDYFIDLKEEIETDKFPFVVDFGDNSFWICNSITCCACAAQRNQILTVSEFKEKVKTRKRIG